MGKIYKVSGNYWISSSTNADDITAHVLGVLGEREVVEAYAQRITPTIAYVSVRAEFEDEDDARDAGTQLQNTPSPWPHDGLQVRKSRRS